MYSYERLSGGPPSNSARDPVEGRDGGRQGRPGAGTGRFSSGTDGVGMLAFISAAVGFGMALRKLQPTQLGKRAVPEQMSSLNPRARFVAGALVYRYCAGNNNHDVPGYLVYGNFLTWCWCSQTFSLTLIYYLTL